MDNKTLPALPKGHKVLKVIGGYRVAKGNYRSMHVYKTFNHATISASKGIVEWETKFKQSQKKRTDRYGNEVRGIFKPKSQHNAVKRFVQMNFKNALEK